MGAKLLFLFILVWSSNDSRKRRFGGNCLRKSARPCLGEVSLDFIADSALALSLFLIIQFYRVRPFYITPVQDE